MVGQNTFRTYNLSNIYGYYDLIEQSIVNGQFNQAKEYIKQFSKTQRIEFFEYLFQDLHIPALRLKQIKALFEVCNG